MGYYENLQKAVDWMEANLKNEITLEEIASSSGYSVSHFYRVFSAVAGMSAPEYLKKRRMSDAMVALMTTRGGIIGIALDCGFDSHEAFTRAFRAAYGAPPSSFRKCCAKPELFERINIISRKKEGATIMTPRIILKGPKALVGIARDMTQGDNIRMGLIGKVQKEFEREAVRVHGRAGAHLYYAAYDYKPEDLSKDDDEIAYTYWFCVESDEEPPEGMVRKEVPRAKYAEFIWDPKKNTLNGEDIGMFVYDYIDGVWVPNSGLELSDEPDYEVHDRQTGLVEINISVK
jgi:AraC family transcriptional regulator